MSKNTTTVIEQSICSLQACRSTLSEIARSCCMSERSPNMKEAQSLLDYSQNKLRVNNVDNQIANACIESVGQFGKKIVYLYASCCTPTREPLYQNIFKELIVVHGNMWKVLGHLHCEF